MVSGIITQMEAKFSDKWNSLTRDINKHIVDTEDFKELVKDNIKELFTNGEHFTKEMDQLNERINLRIKKLDEKFNDYQKEVDEKFKKLEKKLEKKCESWVSYILRKLGIIEFVNWLTGAKTDKLQ